MSQAKVLADRIYSGEGIAADALRIAAANILLVLCAHIVIPLPWTPVPITGQTFGVLLVAALLGSRRGALVMVLYLMEGAGGLPVFQPLGMPAAARFFGPTAGYLLAFPIAAYVTGWIVELRAGKSSLRLLGGLIAGEVIILGEGCAWLAVAMGLSASGAAAMGLVPFLPGEAIKIALVMAAVSGVELARRKK
jgi:biotin transport system substrate-specific component